MSTTKPSAQAPKLRFPGFEGEWKDVAMGELLSFKNGYNAEKEQYGTGVKFINVLDIIQNDYITHDRIIGSVTIPEKDFEKNEVRYGDLLFQRSSETREEVGQANVYLDKETPATFGGFVIRGRPLKEFDSVYFNALLKTAKVRKDMTSRSGGATRYNIGQDSLEEVTVNLSPSLPEQQKIARFLTAVDGRIEQLSRKKALLEEYKKGVMQQLFTQTLRFQDDHGHDFPDWEEKTLGEVITSLDAGVSVNSEDSPAGPTEQGVLKTSCVTKGAFDPNENKRVTDEVERSRLKEPVTANTIIISRMNTPALVGMSGFVRESYPNLFLPDRLWAAKVSPEHSAEWTGHLFGSSMMRSVISSKATGTSGSMKNITKDDVLSIPVQLPSLPEQTKIAGFLSALDGKIAAVGEQLSLTQAWKKGLQQQMFV